MWILKLKLFHKDCHIVPRCTKYNVTTYAFPGGANGGVFKEKGKTYLVGYHLIIGADRDKKLFLADLKKDKRVKKLEIKGNYFTYLFELNKDGEHVQLYYEPRLMFLKPVINSSDGYEYWEVGSYKREALTEFMDKLKKHMDYFELLKLEENKFTDIYFPMILPKLSDKQLQAVMLAKERGYYSYPRKVELKDLAREANVSVPTFQEHLRKAEIKLIPFILEQVK